MNRAICWLVGGLTAYRRGVTIEYYECIRCGGFFDYEHSILHELPLMRRWRLKR